MKKKPATLPRGYRTLTASLAVSDVAGLLAFLTAAFEAEVQIRDNEEDPAFAAVKLGNSRLFVTRGWAPHGHLPVAAQESSPVSQHMYVEDVDAVIGKAIEAGAQLLAEPSDMYWGERCGAIVDPFGHRWTIATRIENLTAEEIAERREPGLSETDIGSLLAEEMASFDEPFIVEGGFEAAPVAEVTEILDVCPVEETEKEARSA